LDPDRIKKESFIGGNRFERNSGVAWGRMKGTTQVLADVLKGKKGNSPETKKSSHPVKKEKRERWQKNLVKQRGLLLRAQKKIITQVKRVE